MNLAEILKRYLNLKGIDAFVKVLSQCRKKEARRTKFKSLEVREASSSHLKIMFKSRIAFHFVMRTVRIFLSRHNFL